MGSPFIYNIQGYTFTPETIVLVSHIKNTCTTVDTYTYYFNIYLNGGHTMRIYTDLFIIGSKDDMKKLLENHCINLLHDTISKRLLKNIVLTNQVEISYIHKK